MSEPRFVITPDDLTEGGSLRTFHQQQVYNVLMNWGMVIVPSDTCYALAALPVTENTYSQINSILNRGEEPMSLSFSNMFDVSRYVYIDNTIANLLENFTPGPLTLVCPARGDVNNHAIAVQKNTKSKDGTIGVRIPDSSLEREVATLTPYPITSAAIRNESGAIVHDFEHAVDIVSKGMARMHITNWAAIRGGNSFLRQHSTVVLIDVLTRDIRIKRQGAITQGELNSAKNQYSQFMLNRGL